VFDADRARPGRRARYVGASPAGPFGGRLAGAVRSVVANNRFRRLMTTRWRGDWIILHA